MHIKRRISHIIWGISIFLLGIFAAYDFSKIIETSSNIEDIRQVTILMLTCRRHEKDFLARSDTLYAVKHQTSLEDLKRTSKRLGSSNVVSELPGDLLNYQTNFKNVIYATMEIGLTENDGLRGSLRSAIHGVETELKNSDYEDFERQMLTCRRYEKDFLIRKDKRSLELFEANINGFLRDASTTNSFTLYDGIF